MILLDKSLYRRFALSFLGILLGFYLLFALIDSSTNIQQLVNTHQLRVDKLLIYYLCQLIKQLHILVPLAFTISTLKLLLSLNRHRELAALMACGVSLKRILTPLVVCALTLSALLLVNFEWGVPKADPYITYFQTMQMGNRSKKKGPRLITLQLSDGSQIVTYGSDKRQLSDVYWLKSSQEIWHFAHVDVKEQMAFGGDPFKRKKNGHLVKGDWVNELQLPPFVWHEKKNESLSALMQNFKHPQDLTQLLFKGFMSLTPLLALVALIPQSVSYKRRSSPFLLYTLALFGFIAFYTIMNSCVIVGEGGLISPWIGLPICPLICGLIFTLRLRHVI